ncbi:MAG TPA: phosphoribosylanthranilate isomerase, partial [bacterium]|nr:phosphoribosylanthranilate isomerase [bacterium]
GLVFYPPSSRSIDLERALRIRDVLPAFVQAVGLFVNPAQQEIEAVLQHFPELVLQFHGDESAEFCAGFGRPYLKALPMGKAQDGVVLDVHAAMALHPRAAGFLLDSHAPGAVGGTGLAFDWSSIPELSRPLILAGGLRPANVGEAVRMLRPWAVDVSSGLESAPGVKDFSKMAEFVDEVRYADCSR